MGCPRLKCECGYMRFMSLTAHGMHYMKCQKCGNVYTRQDRWVHDVLFQVFVENVHDKFKSKLVEGAKKHIEENCDDDGFLDRADHDHDRKKDGYNDD